MRLEWSTVNSTIFTRRSWLAAAASAAMAGCGRKKATRIPGYCFVASQGSRTVAAVNLESFRVQQQISLDAAPSAVVAHPAKPMVYVLAPDAGTVYEIDASTLAVSRRARAGNTAAGMMVSPAKDSLWVLYRDPAMLVELPFDSLKPGRRVALASPPDSFDLVMETKGNRLLAAVASRADRTIALASLANSKVERTISSPAEPSLMTFRRDGALLITGNGPEHSITIFDVATGGMVVRLPLPLAPRHFCSTSQGGQIFITGDGVDGVVVMFPYTTEVYQTILAGRAPGAMAVTDDSSSGPAYLAVTNRETNGITVLDYSDYKLVAIVSVGQSPGQILMTPGPDHQFILVLNEASGDLAVIRTKALATTPNGAQRRLKSAPLFTLIPVGERPVSAAVVTW
jgi:DNA-binding beta-propeller fold protein YncE